MSQAPILKTKPAAKDYRKDLRIKEEPGGTLLSQALSSRLYRSISGVYYMKIPRGLSELVGDIDGLN